MGMQENFVPNPFGGLVGTANSWLNLFSGWDIFKGQVPGLKPKGTLDTLTVMTGANDRMALFGPSMVTNIGPGYSSSFDLVGFGVQNYVPVKFRSAFKFLFGSGDIKLVFGPSTSLLYGGPGGSSKRGPYWDRIAGTWWNPRGKGAKYSAEGSFTPKAVGKGSGDGLQFFERDQIYGEENYDGRELAIMINNTLLQDTKKPLRFKPVTKAFKTENNNQENFVPENKVQALIEKKDLDDVKKNKYESDLEKCYTPSELEVLEKGDMAAKIGTIVIGLLDIAAMTLSIFYANQIRQAGSFTTDSISNANKSRASYDDAKKKADEAKTKLDDWEKSPQKTSDYDAWLIEKDKLQKDYDQKIKDEGKEKEKWQAIWKSGEIKDTEQRDLNWGRTWAIFRFAHRILKILVLTIVETFENTERLARYVLEHKGGVKLLTTQYARNNYLKLEKRQPETSRKSADDKIMADRELNLGLTPAQLEEYAKSLFNKLQQTDGEDRRPNNPGFNESKAIP